MSESEEYKQMIADVVSHINALTSEREISLNKLAIKAQMDSMSLYRMSSGKGSVNMWSLFRIAKALNRVLQVRFVKAKRS